MNREPDWALYRTFLAVLAEQSLSGAARSLGLTQPTVARHVDALEAALGRDLFLRSQRGLAPTEAALELKPYAESLAATAAALVRAAGSHGAAVRGTVRVGASEVVGIEVLPPILAALRSRHPGLAIELALSDVVEDLLRRDADVAVRMVQPEQEALLARRIGSVALGFHARPDYLARRGTPTTWEALEAHDLIGFDRETPAIRAMLKRAGWPSATFAVRVDSAVAQLALIRAGAGIGVCQLPLARRDPALVRVLPDWSLDLPVWLVMHEDLKSSPRCRAVFDGLADGLADYLRDAGRPA